MARSAKYVIAAFGHPLALEVPEGPRSEYSVMVLCSREVLLFLWPKFRPYHSSADHSYDRCGTGLEAVQTHV